MKHVKRIAAAVMISALAAIAVFADQAAYITKEQAEKTALFLQDKTQIVHYCEPCDDHSMNLEEVRTVEAVAAGYQNFWEVKVNGKGIDLAYVYFKDKKGRWKNLAKEMDVKVDDVPKTIDYVGSSAP